MNRTVILFIKGLLENERKCGRERDISEGDLRLLQLV